MNLALIAAALLAAAPAKNKESAMKDAVKSAIVLDKDKGDSDGGAAEKGPGPDVSAMNFTPDNVKAVVAYYQPQIQQCYEEALASKEKDVKGTLKTAWVVGGDGYVKSAKIVKKGTTLNDPHLHDCVIAVLSSMAFPKTPGGKDQPIEYPFNLKPVH